jgi:hypothetical protein
MRADRLRFFVAKGGPRDDNVFNCCSQKCERGEVGSKTARGSRRARGKTRWLRSFGQTTRLRMTMARFLAVGSKTHTLESEASPPHFHLHLSQAAHVKLPQPQLALYPRMAEFHDSSTAAVLRLRFLAGHLSAKRAINCSTSTVRQLICCRFTYRMRGLLLAFSSLMPRAYGTLSFLQIHRVSSQLHGEGAAPRKKKAAGRGFALR